MKRLKQQFNTGPHPYELGAAHTTMKIMIGFRCVKPITATNEAATAKNGRPFVVIGTVAKEKAR
jgi:hypothetical protein